MNIQDELQKIHHQYGISEKANYEIQRLFDKQQERICDSEVIQRIRASKSDAEARRIIRTI